MKTVMHCIPLADVKGCLPVLSILRTFLRSTGSHAEMVHFFDLHCLLVDWTQCLCSFGCPFAVLMVGDRCCLILLGVRPGKLNDQPLSAACGSLLIGGTPRHLW